MPVHVSRQTVHVDYATDPYPTIPFTVESQVSRIVVTWTFPGTSANYTEAELAGPGGVFVNEANQLGFSNNLVLTAEHARSGTWQFLPEIRGYDGPATLIVRSYRSEREPLGRVRLRPHTRVTVPVPVPAAPDGGDRSSAVTVANRHGTVLTSVPVTVRTIADVTRGAATLAGSLDGGDGFGAQHGAPVRGDLAHATRRQWRARRNRRKARLHRQDRHRRGTGLGKRTAGHHERPASARRRALRDRAHHKQLRTSPRVHHRSSAAPPVGSAGRDSASAHRRSQPPPERRRWWSRRRRPG